MSKSTTILSAALVLFSNMSSFSVYAKSASELQNEANKLSSHAANKEAKADAEEKESSLSIDEGKKGTAAIHAKRAAAEQKVANDLAEKATKVQDKASKKAVKEAY